MLVVLLTAALLVLSSAQRAEEDLNNDNTSGVQPIPNPAEKTQDSELGPSAAAANIGNIQESSPLVKVDPSSNSGNEQQVEPEESQQAESQEHCDSSGKQEKNQPRKRNVVEVKNLSSSPENSQGSPQQIHSKQKPLIEGGSGQERVPPPLHPPKFFRPRVPNNYVPFWLGPRRN
ncbi:uncharacterized protein LOC545884 precursor [Mus musculus]|uniref:uncharacterized protein LOC545884 precursor n=1 Tax=Mus musculus TaxID=10090 RepID=UPI000019318B|nr:uncharacterized protein LOC545884 precursor [Mus musculus]|eukprot:NP_001171969.1 predicted gene 5885 precursor [Mus musculus]